MDNTEEVAKRVKVKRDKREFLTNLKERSPEERRAIAASGGRAKGANNKPRKELRKRMKIAEELFNKILHSKFLSEGKKSDADIVNQVGLVVKTLYEVAIQGEDKKSQLAALNMIMDRTDGKPVQTSIVDASYTDKGNLTEDQIKLIQDSIVKKASQLNKTTKKKKN
jgi:hypothetical protein